MDFGNECVVKLGHLKKIKREFLNLPFQVCVVESFVFHVMEEKYYRPKFSKNHFSQSFSCFISSSTICVPFFMSEISLIYFLLGI